VGKRVVWKGVLMMLEGVEGDGKRREAGRRPAEGSTMMKNASSFFFLSHISLWKSEDFHSVATSI